MLFKKRYCIVLKQIKNMKANKKRLEYLRKELREERISYEELVELQSLVKHIDSNNDIELLEAAGVPEFKIKNNVPIKHKAMYQIKENNILIKKDVEKLITGRLSIMNVCHVNGKIYSTKRSCKGCYIVVDGIRKYIVRDETY